MARVMVYYFTQYNIVTDEKVHSARPATLEAIGKIENAIVLAYSTDFCHPVHGNVATQSMGMLPPSPRNVATLGA